MSTGQGSGTGLAQPTARGRDYPSIRQFTVFLENRVGQLLEVIRRFERTSTRIVAMNIHDFTRRRILLGATTWAATHTLRAAGAPPRKAAVIGHTGAGDYGHGVEHLSHHGHRHRRHGPDARPGDDAHSLSDTSNAGSDEPQRHGDAARAGNPVR